VKESITVSLTGGLGNQLFQLVNGLKAAQGRPVSLEYKIGKPRLNQFGLPEVSSFSLPTNVQLLNLKEPSWVLRKACGFTLRSSIFPRHMESTYIFRKIVQIVASVLVSQYLRCWHWVQSGRNLGFSELGKIRSKTFLIGYFQTFQNALDRSTRKDLHFLVPSFGKAEIDSYRILAQVEHPVVIHLRLTDYNLENAFGIPSPNYYKDALRLLGENIQIGKVWIFSDDQEKAREILPQSITQDARWIPEICQSAACTLEVMRLGSHYIIGNSTFSWWGAFLSYADNATVIAPRPWFQGMEEPRDLIPANWLRVDAWK